MMVPVDVAAIRNVALVAHVDHGKTTLVDAILRQTGVFSSRQELVERVLDSTDQERERGITILAKAASVKWRGVKVNLVDTPGHADFGGEVERALAMVDGVLLLPDAVLRTVPAPIGDPGAPLQALVTNLDASEYLGRLAVGRIVRGTLRAGRAVTLVHAAGAAVARRPAQLLAVDGLGRTEVEELTAGDLFVLAGFPDVQIGDTLADPDDPDPLER